MATAPQPVIELLQRQGGVARRRDLHEAGLTRRRLERYVQDGHLRVVAGDVLSAQREAQPGELLRAAVAGLAGAACGESAAGLWGMDLVRKPSGLHVAVSRERSRAAWPATTVHRTDLEDDERTRRLGTTLTTPVRTLLDLCRALPLHEAVAAADSALHRGLVTSRQLVRAVIELPAGPGRQRVARVVGLVDPEAGSVLESLFRMLVVLGGIEPPTSQLVVRRRDGAVIGRVDFAWEEHGLVVETDGFAFHADRARYAADRKRGNALQLAGWRVLRYTWEDVQHQPHVVLAELSEALAR